MYLSNRESIYLSQSAVVVLHQSQSLIHNGEKKMIRILDIMVVLIILG